MSMIVGCINISDVHLFRIANLSLLRTFELMVVRFLTIAHFIDEKEKS